MMIRKQKGRKNNKKLKVEHNTEKEPKHEQGANLKQIILKLVKILLIENYIYPDKPSKSIIRIGPSEGL